MRDIYSHLVAGVLLVLMAVLTGGAAMRESITVDEVAHIGAGVSYLQKLDMRLNEEHPPLAKVLAGLPLVVRGVHADYNQVSWTFSEKFFPAYSGQWVFGEWLVEKWNEPKALLEWARLPMLLLTLALGWVVYACAKRLGGAWAGLLCLSVYVSAPVFLTFGALVNTDIAVTLFSLLALWTFAEVWRKPSGRNVLLFAMSLAGALLSKFTAGILFFAFIAFALSLRWRAVAGQPSEKVDLREWRRERRRAILKGIFWAALIVYLFYFIFSWNQSSAALERIGAGSAAMVFRRMLLPFVLYLRGVAWVLITGSRPTFVLGHSHPHGVWFYFPVVFVLKSQLGFLGLLILSLVAGVSRKLGRGKRGDLLQASMEAHWRILWVSLIVFTAVCMLSPLDISIRHFSVPIVLLVLLLAPLPSGLRELSRQSGSATALAGVAVALLAVSGLFTAVRTYPYYFPYVNALSFGRPAYTLMNDSNVDWNQSLPEVRKLAEQMGLEKIKVDAYGFSDVNVSVPQAEIWNCQTPKREDAGEWVALSANMILDGHNCGWLANYPLQVLAGGSMFAVRMPAVIPPAGSAGGPPLADDFRQMGGVPFDMKSLFTHVEMNPQDLPRAFEWMMANFSHWDLTEKTVPKFPWEQ
jgi:hypothetical protein